MALSSTAKATLFGAAILMRRRRRYVGVVVPSEHQEQAELFKQLRLRLKDHPELGLAYAIPNGTRTSIHVARRMKAEGVKTGIPDICLPVARGGYFGLYIELKARPFRDENRRLVKQGLRPEQKVWIKALREQNYLACEPFGCDQALVIMLDYLRLQPTVNQLPGTPEAGLETKAYGWNPGRRTGEAPETKTDSVQGEG